MLKIVAGFFVILIFGRLAIQFLRKEKLDIVWLVPAGLVLIVLVASYFS